LHGTQLINTCFCGELISFGSGKDVDDDEEDDDGKRDDDDGNDGWIAAKWPQRASIGCPRPRFQLCIEHWPTEHGIE
jgi:hypothetical protein